MIQLDSLESPEAIRTASRSRLYSLLAAVLQFPTPELHEQLEAGAYGQALLGAAEALPYSLVLVRDALVASFGYTDFQAEYIRLFDVGPKGPPPCTLYEGEYRGGGRMQVMEDLLRFYQHFGLALSPERRELPDHLTVQLEFLHYLTFKELAALTRGLDPSPYRRAQKDFLERHPSRWLPHLRAKILRERALPPFPALVGAVHDLVRAELAYLGPLLTSA